MGALWWPVQAQTVTETVTINGTNNSLYKDVKTEDIYAGSGFDIGRYLNLGAGGDTLNNEISRTYYAFDVEDVLSANNLTINSVKLKYTTIQTGSYTFKVTNTESITKALNQLSQSERESYYAAIGNASALHQGLAYNGNGNTTTITSSGIKTILEGDLSKKILYLGALSQSESTDGSETQLVLKLEINYTYSAYDVTVRNDFNGSPNGGQVGVSKNSASLVSQSAPYNISVVNGDIINIEAYDNQVQGNYTWVFNDLEAIENKSNWIHDDGEDRTPISSNKTTSHTANNDQGSTLLNEQRKLFNVVRKDQTELGTFTGQAYADVVDGNTRDISAPATKTVSSRVLEFVGWTDISSTSQNRTVTPTDHTDYTALYKGSQITNTTANNGKPGQQKMVRTGDGFLHRVYESLGHVWYEVKPPGGDWEFVNNIGGRVTIDETGGSSPSIDVSTFSYPDPNNVILVWQEGANIKMQIFEAHNGSYTWHMSGQFSTGESSTFDTKPNVAWSGTNEFAIIWHTSSGIKYRIYYIGGSPPTYAYFATRASGTLSGTTSSSIDAAISSDKNYIYPYYDIAWVQNSGSTSSIKFKSLSTDGTTTYEVPVIPLTVSSTSHPVNTNVSIVSSSEGATMGWVCKSTTAWSPMSTYACLRRFDYSSLKPFNIFNQSVASASIAKVGTGVDYYFAWSEEYYYPESQYNNDANRYVKRGAFSTKRTLNTNSPNIQLYDGDTGSNMHLSTFTNGTPKYFDLSNSLETTAKSLSEAFSQGRGIAVSDDNGAGAFIEIGSVLINNEPVLFEEIAEPDSKGDRLERIRSAEEPDVKSISDVVPFLLSEPFDLNSESRFTFSERFGIGDSLSLKNLLGEQGELSFSIELVNATSNQLVATLKTVRFNAGELNAQLEKEYEVQIPSGLNEKVRIRINPQSNIPGLHYELITSYRDDGSVSAKEKSVLSMEDLNVITEYGLSQNYPNPFNPTTQIEYQIPAAGLVQLEVFDMLGRKVQTLVNDFQEVGKYSVSFDASSLASGTYLYRLSSGGFVATQKMFLIK